MQQQLVLHPADLVPSSVEEGKTTAVWVCRTFQGFVLFSTDKAFYGSEYNDLN